MIWRQHIHKVVLRLPDSWSNWNLEMLVLKERGKQEYLEKNLSEQRREPTTNSTHIWVPGFEPGPHQWEATALTTAPSLAPPPLLPHSVVHVQNEILLIYLWWFNFVPGLNFIFFCFKLIVIHYHTLRQRKIKLNQRRNILY